jgi:hypothetical protein
VTAETPATQYPARDRLFGLIASIPGSGTADWCGPARALLDEYRAEVLAEPAVSSSAPADRAALELARGIARRLAAHAVGFQDVLDDTDRGPWARTVGADIAALCTALGERTVLAPPATDLAAASDPTPLRWGLNDVLWGDDDTVTVLLSGPAGEPYWLELDPERAGVLREDLAGPDGAVAVDRAAVLDEAADALDAYIARYRSPSIANWTGAVTFLHRMAGEARDERETQANLDTLAEDLHRWTDEAQQHEPGVVAYRSSGARVLRCLTHAPVDLTGFTPVTSEDLPDGGICTHPDCGVDVLIPQQPEAAEGAQQ